MEWSKAAERSSSFSILYIAGGWRGPVTGEGSGEAAVTPASTENFVTFSLEMAQFWCKFSCILTEILGNLLLGPQQLHVYMYCLRLRGFDRTCRPLAISNKLLGNFCPMMRFLWHYLGIFWNGDWSLSAVVCFLLINSSKLLIWRTLIIDRHVPSMLNRLLLTRRICNGKRRNWIGVCSASWSSGLQADRGGVSGPLHILREDTTRRGSEWYMQNTTPTGTYIGPG